MTNSNEAEVEAFYEAVASFVTARDQKKILCSENVAQIVGQYSLFTNHQNPNHGDIIRKVFDARKLTLETLNEAAKNIEGARWRAQDENAKLAILRRIRDTSWINKPMEGTADAPVTKDDITDFIKQQLPQYVSFSELKGISEESELIARARQQDLRYLVFDYKEIKPDNIETYQANNTLITAIQQTNPTLTSIIDFGYAQSTGDGFGQFSPLSGRAIIQGDSLTSIGGNFFAFCNGVNRVDLPGLSNVNSIAEGFLSHCSSLTELDLEECISLSSIGHSFLWGCYQVTDIALPTSLQSLGKDAFITSNALKNIFCSDAVKGMLPANLQIKCRPLKK